TRSRRSRGREVEMVDLPQTADAIRGREDLHEPASILDATVAYLSQSKDLTMTSSANTALAQWALDREIVLSRVISARRNVVFSAWADAKHPPNWFGPAGFEIETKEIDIRVGGLWRFDMIAPNGRRYSNRMQFRRIEHRP